MNKILFSILMCTLICAGLARGQSKKNPFDLLHRKGNRPVPELMAPDTSKSGKKGTATEPALVTPVQPDTIPPDTILADRVNAESEVQEESGGNDNLFILPEPSADSGIFDSSKFRETQEGLASPDLEDGAVTSSAQKGMLGPDDSLTIEEIIPVAPERLVKRKKLSGAFLALIFLGILLLLTIIVNINRKLLQQVYRASLNENYSALLYRERKHSAFNYLYSIAYVIFFINAGLFIYQVQFLDIWFHPKTYALWVFILFPVVIYTIRHLVMRLLATVFPISKEVNQFNFNIVVFNIMIGLFLIPVNLFIAFGPAFMHVPIVYASIVAIGLFYIFRQLRGVLIATPLLQNSLFLFFIYLCTVEILPLAVIFKLLA